MTLNGGITFKALETSKAKPDVGVGFFPLMSNLTLGENGKVSVKFIGGKLYYTNRYKTFYLSQTII